MSIVISHIVLAMYRYASQLIHDRVLPDLGAARSVSGSSAFLTTTCELVLSIAETLGAAGVYTNGVYWTGRWRDLRI